MKSYFLHFNFFLVLFLCHVHPSMAQNAYYDAIELAKYLKEDGSGFQTKDVATVEKWSSILAKYLDTNEDLTTEMVVDSYTGFGDAPYDVKNPFLEPLMPEGLLMSNAESAEAVLKVNRQKKSAFSAIGGMKVSRFADGLAQFLIERSKEEIYVSYFERLQETFKDYPEFPLLLSQSSEFLQLFESYQYAAMVPALREAVKKDMENIPNRLLSLKRLTDFDCGNDEPNCKERMAEYQRFFEQGESKLFIATTVLLNQFIEGANPAEMLEVLATHEDFTEVLENPASENFVNGIKMLHFFSDNLRQAVAGESYEEDAETIEVERLWITKADWKKLDRPTLRIFLGLMYQKSEAATIEFFVEGEAKSLQAILGGFAEDFNPIESFLTGMVDRVEILDNHLKTVREKKALSEDFSYRDYHTYYAATVNLLKHLLTIDKAVSGINVSGEVHNFVDLADIGGEVYYDLHTRNFSTAVLNLIVMLDKSMKDDFENSQFRKQFLKYGTFMAALAEAEDAVGVKTVIEATVLPVGSARIKRDTKSNVALNAYLGGFVSGEYLTELNQWNSTIGIYAPVGMSFSKGIRKRKEGLDSKKEYKSGGSWSVFLSVIDIGAVTAFRMNDDSTEALPELRLENILAPGLQIIKGCAKSPMSWGIGIQAGPMLRTIRGEEGIKPSAIFNDKLNYRIQAFLAVDIPLINFKTEPW
ncbi:MAG: hypothetical protein R3E32_28655 [Chitinophagales bacterium]